MVAFDYKGAGTEPRAGRRKDNHGDTETRLEQRSLERDSKLGARASLPAGRATARSKSPSSTHRRVKENHSLRARGAQAGREARAPSLRSRPDERRFS